MVLLKLIVIRHGYSCVNAGKEINDSAGKQYKWYPDPPLTALGIAACKAKQRITFEIINDTFPETSYKIGTSCLMRAQQSAYYTLLHTDGVADVDIENKYSIFPHIGEKYEGGTDNIPLSPEMQQKRLGFTRTVNDEQPSAIIKKPADYSDVKQFFDWVNSLSVADAAKFFHVTEGIYQAVIFTHKKFIADLLNLPAGTKVNNNDVLYAEIDTTLVKISNLEILLDRDTEIKDKSQDGCDIKMKYIRQSHPGVSPAIGDETLLTLGQFLELPFPEIPRKAVAIGGSRKRRAKKQNRKARLTRKSKYSLQKRRV